VEFQELVEGVIECLDVGWGLGRELMPGEGLAGGGDLANDGREREFVGAGFLAEGAEQLQLEGQGEEWMGRVRCEVL
jgi:hypothetical protein